MSDPPQPRRLPSDILGCNYDPAHPEKSISKGCSEFTFETDHLALRSNPDYRKLLSTLATLEAQRAQAVKDTEAFLAAKDAAMDDPLEVVAKLNRGESLNLPEKQNVADLPDIDWDRYNVSVDDILRAAFKSKNDESPSRDVPFGETSVRSPLSKAEFSAAEEVGNRGLDADKKPKTFNQPWTAEEQDRLEELLELYPTEEVEMDRWKKIAHGLGNRTAVQVQSRVQKYFRKLQRAGRPVPGRPVPGRQGKGRNRHAKGPKAQDKKSTCVSSPSVSLAGQDSSRTSTGGGGILNDRYYHEERDVSDEETVSESFRGSPAYTELMWKKRIRRERELEKQMSEPMVHYGFRCDGCSIEPIVGGRFQCVECMEQDTVDFCCDCAPKGLEIGKHVKSHVLRPVRRKTTAEASVDNA